MQVNLKGYPILCQSGIGPLFLFPSTLVRVWLPLREFPLPHFFGVQKSALCRHFINSNLFFFIPCVGACHRDHAPKYVKATAPDWRYRCGKWGKGLPIMGQSVQRNKGCGYWQFTGSTPQTVVCLKPCHCSRPASHCSQCQSCHQ